MTNINELINLRDEVLFHFLKTDMVDKAKREFFKLMDDEEVEADFTDWFIHDFKESGLSLIDHYREMMGEDIRGKIDVLNDSYLMFAKFNKTENNNFFKDIITNRDFIIQDDDEELVFNTNNIYLIRLYKSDEVYIPSDDYKEFDAGLEKMMVKSLLEKYNEKFKLGSIGIDEFIYGSPIILVALANIIDTVEIKNAMDDLYCYESSYKIVDKKLLKEELSSLNLNDTEFSDVFKLEYKDRIIAEIVIENEFIEIDANNETDRMIVKDILKDCKSIVFINDKVTSFEELI